jgi:PAS domain S-box-containing protein
MGSNSKSLKKRIAWGFIPVLAGWTVINGLVVYGLHQMLRMPGIAEQKTILDFPPVAFGMYLLLWGTGVFGIIYSAYQAYRYISVQKKIQNELRQSEDRFRQLVELSPNVIAVHQDGVVVFVNRAGLLLFGANDENEIIGKPVIDFVHPESRPTVLRRIAEMTQTGQPAPRMEEKFVLLDGSVIEVGVISIPLEFRGKLAFEVIIEDTTIRKRLERAIQSIELGISSTIGQAFFESAVSHLANTLESDTVFIGEYLPATESVRTLSAFRDGGIVPNFEYPLQGAPCENVINRDLCCYPNGVAGLFPRDKSLKENGVEGYLGMPLWDSGHNPVGIIAVLYRHPISSPDFAKGLVQIFASRIQAEMERAGALNALVESKAQLEAAFNNIPFEIWLSGADGRCIKQNPVSRQYWGNTEGKLPETLKLPVEIRSAWAERNQRVLSGQVAHDSQVIQKDGKSLYFDTILAPIQVGNRITGFVGVNIDVTEHIQSELKNRNNIERLSALRDIDQVILGGNDIRAVMDGICGHVSALLRVDAVEILRYDSSTLTLETLARRGIESYSLFNHFPVQDDIASKAVLEQKVIFEQDFPKLLEAFPNCDVMKMENFRTYIAIPLIAKGFVRGVLEVFQHTDLNPDDDWWELAQALANQAAIAIDNLSLFQDLQRSNADLCLAYDLTLEGWSKALEIRDQETEGHAQRVTTLTLRLTEALGVPRNQIIHIRRGALLHDIGKMGIPDKILHKPGPLTDEEWRIVKKHPQMAFDLLLPIPFLHRALDIPYCHHERWNGSGYPRGLKGKDIPLAARIFSVVDVWDALTSDRPYRAAISPQKASRYLREQSGQYFDPEIVKVFEKVILKL